MAIDTKFFKVGTDKIFKVGGNVAGILPPNPLIGAFVSASGITDPVQITAIAYLVDALNSANLLGKFDFIYPMVGGTALTHSYNLVDTSTFQLTFFGGWVHSANGALPNNTNTYANTGYSPSVAGLAYNDNHLSYYSRTSARGATSTSFYDMGSADGGGGTSLFIRRNTDLSGYDSGTFTINRLSTTNLDGRGFYCGSSNPSNIGYYQKNGLTVATKNPLVSTFMRNFNYYIGAFNEYNTNIYYSNKECAFASAGRGLTETEMTTFYTIVQEYQTILGRNV